MGLLTGDQPLAVVKATDILHSSSLLPPLLVPYQTARAQQAQVGCISPGRGASENKTETSIVALSLILQSSVSAD